MSTTPSLAAAAPQQIRQLLNTPSRGMGTWTTIVKAAVAASVSFAIAVRVGPEQYASLAPVIALFTVQGSVIETLGQGLQLVLGNVLGVGLTAIWVQHAGTTWWSILIAIVVSLAVARVLPLGAAAQYQIPLAVLLTVLLGPGSGSYGLHRVVAAGVGGLVGIAVGVALPERPPFGPAQENQYSWAQALADQLGSIAAALEAAPIRLGEYDRHEFMTSSTDLNEIGDVATESTAAAEEGVFFNPRGRRERDQLGLLRRRQRELTRLTLQIRVLALTVDQMYDRPWISPRLDRSELAALVRGLEHLFRQRREGTPVVAESVALRARIAKAVADVAAKEPAAYDVLESVSLLGRLEQLRQEMTVDAADPSDGRAGGTDGSGGAGSAGNAGRGADEADSG
jgi:uncharacterized membrane protein YgaE (UPF0421/DUF939 family)